MRNARVKKAPSQLQIILVQYSGFIFTNTASINKQADSKEVLTCMRIKFVMGEDYSRAEFYYLLFPLLDLPLLLQLLIDPPGKLIRR